MPRRAGVIDWRATAARAGETMATLGLDLDPRSPVRKLRPDQAQMVEIARALSINARVLILDEPTSSLTDDAVSLLFASVRRLCDHGVATVFVSHRLDEIFSICDRVTVLRDGRTVGEAPISGFDRELARLADGRCLAGAGIARVVPPRRGGQTRAPHAQPLPAPGRSPVSTSMVRAGRDRGSRRARRRGPNGAARIAVRPAPPLGGGRGRRRAARGTALRRRRCGTASRSFPPTGSSRASSSA